MKSKWCLEVVREGPGIGVDGPRLRQEHRELHHPGSEFPSHIMHITRTSPVGRAENPSSSYMLQFLFFSIADCTAFPA